MVIILLTHYVYSVYYKNMDSRTIIKLLESGGWVIKRTRGSHHHFVHPSKKGVVTVPHPKRDLPKGTLISIEKQSGLELRRKKK